MWSVFLFESMLRFCLLFKINFQDSCQQNCFAFWFYYASENYSHSRCVPDRVRDEVFLAASVVLLAAHSCLACSGLQLLSQTRIWGSCQDTQGTTASCYRVLLCTGRAQPGRAGSGLCQCCGAACLASGGVLGFTRCAALAAHSAWRARCLPLEPYVLGLSPFLDVSCTGVVGVSPLLGRALGHQWTPRLCMSVLLLLEFAFKKSVSKLLCVVTPREWNQVSPVCPLIRVI